MNKMRLKTNKTLSFIIALIMICGLFIYLDIELSSVFTNTSKINRNGDESNAALSIEEVNEGAEKAPQIAIESIQLDFLEVKEFLSIRLDEFIASYGEPIKQEFIYNDYLGENTASLYYGFCEAMFIPIYNQKGKLSLSNITIKTNDIVAPYSISVGDELDTIFLKLPRTTYEGGRPPGISKDAFSPNIEVIYLSEDGRDYGFIYHNTADEISAVEYSQNYETGGVTSLKLEIIQGRVTEIQIWQGYM